MIQVSCWALYQDGKRSDPDTVAQTSLIAARSQLSSSRGVWAHIPEIFHGTQMLQDKIKPLNYDVFQEVLRETSQSQLGSNSSLLESFTKRSFVKKDKGDDNWWIWSSINLLARYGAHSSPKNLAALQRQEQHSKALMKLQPSAQCFHSCFHLAPGDVML